MSKTGRKTNICFDCQNACGGCSWSELDPETGKTRFEPVLGWTAEPVTLNLGWCIERTYHITACPQFVPDPPRKRRAADLYLLTEEQSRLFAARGGKYI
jgi:hypothetical protein